jgi:hypothetical protein
LLLLFDELFLRLTKRSGNTPKGFGKRSGLGRRKKSLRSSQHHRVKSAVFPQIQRFV